MKRQTLQVASIQANRADFRIFPVRQTEDFLFRIVRLDVFAVFGDCQPDITLENFAQLED